MKAYTWQRMMPRRQCAAGSIRSKAVGRGASYRMLRVCCPKGPRHWDARTETCRVGTRVYEKGTPK